MSTWYLEINGVRRALSGWQIESASLKLANQSTDQLSFTTKAETALGFGDRVVLWFGTERRFSGLLTSTAYSESAKSPRRSYIASGAWYFLEKIVFQQSRYFLIDAFAIAKGYTTQSASKSVLFLDTVGGASVSPGAQAKAAIDYAIAKGAAIARTTTFDIDPGLVPWETADDISCADVIRRCARWTRDVVAWWDYSVTVPVLHIGRRPNLDAVALDLEDGNSLLNLTVEPCWDLQPSGVLIHFIKTEVNAAGEEWLSMFTRSAGAATGGMRCVVITIRLGGKGANSEPEPTGLATLFWNSVKDLQWTGSISLHSPGASATLRPGCVLNLAAGDAAWATMRALVQAVEEDLLTGVLRAEFGPPRQLGVQDFADLIATRAKTNGGSGGSSSVGGDGTSSLNGQPPDGGGSSGGSSGGAGGGPSSPTTPTDGKNGTIPLQVCVDGKPVVVNVQGNFAK